MTASEAVEALAWPEIMEFVGGPYCGAVLVPRQEMIYSVSAETFVGPTMPTNFIPIDGDTVVMRGGSGLILYRDSAWEDSKWGYVQAVEPEWLEEA